MSVYRFPLPTLLQASFPSNGIRQDVDRVLQDVFAQRPAVTQPSTDAREDATGFTLELDLPGVAPEAVEVLAEDGVLTIKGNRPARVLGEEEKPVFIERSAGAIARRFRLPKSADLSTISATYANGVLSVRVGKIAPAQPRRVTVNIAS